uniref:SAM domain-containing protein n=1 Tax=Mola mola TaxID=94237 RepID=A0A3Q3W4Y7_MOLML
PGSVKPEPSEAQHDREEKEDEEEEEGGPGPENARGQSVDPEWVEERFRIDRKKLENMLYVMRETDTQVKWPSKLKIGAKSKKPHVKVEGKRDNVLEAKKKILEVLETKVNKVTLKMDVAYTEHSHVIGKGGGNIKKVMEVTSCHIHFPDSNRHNAAGEKSNQVSIAGPIEGVEDARRRIRDLQPLSMTFDLQVSLVPQTLPDAGSPLIQQVVQTLGVSVSFRAVPPHPQVQPTFYESCCTVWGLQGNTAAKATCILMDLLLGSEVTVSSQLDVTSQQHLFLLGQNGANFLSVMHQTQTQIILPDLSAPQSPPSLLIQGSPDGVCLARQQLMDCLPVCLMFDMREDGEADPCKLAQMMQNLGVFISVKPKVKQTSKSVVVKGLERNISCLYDARRLLLGLDYCETAKVTQMTPDLMLASSGLTNNWLNMLLQQLRLSEQMQRKPVVTEIRTPTDTWSGLGFSKSMPTEAIKELRNVSRRCYKPYLSTISNGKVYSGSDSENWRDRRGSTPTSVPVASSSSPSSSPPSPPVTDDLPELLSQLGLIKYIDVFEQQEIDYQTFLTLSEDDLKEVGVSTFGARRKMLMAITLNKSKRRLSDTPAVKPGYLEGGASGRLPRIRDLDISAAQSNRW